jgi:dTMP kinase
MKKGKFITLYGINNIGKSTQAKLLLENLRNNGYDAVYVKYPVYDLEPTGVYLNNVLRAEHGEQKMSEEELQMWFTLNRFQFEGQLKEWLQEGKIVVAEDYTGTGLSWGSAKGANLEWLMNLNQHLIKEDFAIFLKGKRNLHAKEQKHLHENNDDLMEACQFIMENLAEKLKWHKVIVKPSISETAKDVWETVEEFLKKK